MPQLIEFLEQNGFYPRTEDLEAILRRCDHDADRHLTFEEFCENLLRREELEYDVYDGENYEAEHYGKEHWHLRADVDSLLARHRQAQNRQPRERLEPTIQRNSSM